MKVFRDLAAAAAASFRRPVVTLGVFDGVHVGHRLVIDHVVSLARERAGDAVVVTFGRHPRAVIENRAPKLITSLDHRLRIFESLGVTATLVLEFDEALRAMPARTFAQSVFHDTLGAEVVILGYNNRFGEGGEGDIDVLTEVGKAAGFEARQVDEIRLGAQPMSSTEIRRAILGGDLDRAALMLGRPVSVLGTVEEGDGIGRTLGFPTANLDLHHEVRPPPGVYGCEALFGGGGRFGLVNIGVRPTVTSGPASDGSDWEARDATERVEVHLLDFTGDLYGQQVEVFFLTRLRDERRFDGLDDLRDQIQRDREAFFAWLDGVRRRR
ncbi:MAG: riboflavin biosynthesis protein RibF [Planctomycetes bacterium]|nr:riboflavin biosynthesis protein RibF [Planctomycetota bacterium]